MARKSAELLPEVGFNTAPTYDADGVQATAGITADGKEQVDSTPMAPPIGYSAPPDLMTMIRTMIQSEAIRQELAKQDFETFEEADDFELEDDPIDALTEYERVFEPPPPVPTPPSAASSSASPPAASPQKASTEALLDISVLADTSADTKNNQKNNQSSDKSKT